MAQLEGVDGLIYGLMTARPDVAGSQDGVVRDGVTLEHPSFHANLGRAAAFSGSTRSFVDLDGQLRETLEYAADPSGDGAHARFATLIGGQFANVDYQAIKTRFAFSGLLDEVACYDRRLAPASTLPSSQGVPSGSACA